MVGARLCDVQISTKTSSVKRYGVDPRNSIRATREPAILQELGGTQDPWGRILHADFPKLGFGPRARGDEYPFSDPHF